MDEIIDTMKILNSFPACCFVSSRKRQAIILSKNLLRLGFIFLGTLFFQNSPAQDNYLPAYIIIEKNDTIFGYINQRRWNKNPQVIQFKKEEEDNPTSFSPTDILEFSTYNEIYISGFVELEVSARGDDQLTEDPVFNLRKDSVFLQCLFKGDKSLYYHIDRDGKENFFIERETGIDLLEYKRYIKRITTESLVIVKNKNYIGQLSLYLKDCSSISSFLPSEGTL